MGLRVPSDITDIDPVASLISKFLDSEALAALPPPEWLIKDWVPKGALVQMIGQPGEGKSFVALDQAMHVALGREWHGHRVTRAKVGYMVAEGASGMGQRVKAWEKRFNGGEQVTGITFIPFPIQAGDPAAWETLILACARLGFGYIVIDTQARVTVALEENSAKEMGQFVHAADRLLRMTGATVTLVHHLNKAGGSARGSGAMKGAVNTEITVSKSENRVTSKVTKQKDAEEGPPLTLQLVSEEVGRRAGVGWSIGPVDEVIYAGVLIDVDPIDAQKWADGDAMGKMLMILTDIFPNRGATKAEACGEAVKRGLSKTHAYRTWDQCLGKGLVGVALDADDRPTSRFKAVPIDQRPLI